jgi:hypothetical protein
MKIFNIPIYRTSIDKFEEEFRSDKLKKEDIEQVDWNYVERINTILDSLWFPWEFNEIIGYIRISATSTDIEGVLFIGNHQRIRRNYHQRKIRYDKMLFRINYNALTKGSEILVAIRNEIEKLAKKEKSLKHRYVDINSFENIAKYFDWDKIIQVNRLNKTRSATELLNDMVL